MNARTDTRVDVKRLEKGAKDIEGVLEMVKRAQAKAQTMLDVDLEALDKEPTNVEFQGQVLKLTDYIIKQEQNSISLADQITQLKEEIAKNS